VGRHDDVVKIEQRVVGRGRLFLENVQSGSGELLVSQRIDQRCLIDDRASISRTDTPLWDALLRATSDPAGAFDWIAARLEQPSPHDILRQRLLTTLAWVDDERVRQIAWRWAADRGSSAEARSAAVQRLGESQIRSLEIARFLGELLEEPSYRLRSACLDALAELDNPEARRILRAFYKQPPDGGQRRVIEAALRRTW